ncbi:hypothetical protein AYJ54_37310 [Bradyrhizobium centrolobii]|uniref:Uncharacterized protein n=1 Tax=Bradyrhizobium centrolobii TaxID=1505087 RepID=A0A176ZAT0_9BRAD|nr:hypothetical protein AYJ54_37310 [Bradyrhizobium centrolobii]
MRLMVDRTRKKLQSVKQEHGGLGRRRRRSRQARQRRERAMPSTDNAFLIFPTSRRSHEDERWPSRMSTVLGLRLWQDDVGHDAHRLRGVPVAQPI